MAQARMAKSDNYNLIWIDLEMTGLKTDSDVHHRDRNRGHGQGAECSRLRAGACDPSAGKSVLAGMDDWNQKQHGSSGLLVRVRASSVSAARGRGAHA
jgi:oligoribonuclease